ncbi:unnamed protein product [Pedinophyceae sp. YPF-701]|nr:unnamed protein product [Pedinophyceae sp. YPF-701]
MDEPLGRPGVMEDLWNPAKAARHLLAGDGGAVYALPRWRLVVLMVCVVLTSITFTVGLGALKRWLHRSSRVGVAWMLKALEEELLALGFISLLLFAIQEELLKICVPCDDQTCDDPLHKDDACPDGSEQFFTRGAIHSVHLLIFLIACTHVTYLFFSLLVVLLKMRRWVPWEQHASAAARHGLELDLRSRRVADRKTSRALRRIRHYAHAVMGTVMDHIEEADYHALRTIVVQGLGIHVDFDFLHYLVMGVEEEYAQFFRVGWINWVLVAVWVVVPYSAYIFAILSLLATVVAGYKLSSIANILANQAFLEYGSTIPAPGARPAREDARATSRQPARPARRRNLERASATVFDSVVPHPGEDGRPIGDLLPGPPATMKRGGGLLRQATLRKAAEGAAPSARPWWTHAPSAAQPPSSRAAHVAEPGQPATLNGGSDSEANKSDSGTEASRHKSAHKAAAAASAAAERRQQREGRTRAPGKAAAHLPAVLSLKKRGASEGGEALAHSLSAQRSRAAAGRPQVNGVANGLQRRSMRDPNSTLEDIQENKVHVPDDVGRRVRAPSSPRSHCISDGHSAEGVTVHGGIHGWLKRTAGADLDPGTAPRPAALLQIAGECGFLGNDPDELDRAQRELDAVVSDHRAAPIEMEEGVSQRRALGLTRSTNLRRAPAAKPAPPPPPPPQPQRAQPRHRASAEGRPLHSRIMARSMTVPSRRGGSMDEPDGPEKVSQDSTEAMSGGASPRERRATEDGSGVEEAGRGRGQRAGLLSTSALIRGRPEELFWFSQPILLLRMLQFSFFENALSIAVVLLLAWVGREEEGGASEILPGSVPWFMLLTLLTVDVAVMIHASWVSVPLYGIVSRAAASTRLSVLRYFNDSQIKPQLLRHLQQQRGAGSLVEERPKRADSRTSKAGGSSAGGDRRRTLARNSIGKRLVGVSQQLMRGVGKLANASLGITEDGLASPVQRASTAKLMDAVVKSAQARAPGAVAVRPVGGAASLASDADDHEHPTADNLVRKSIDHALGLYPGEQAPPARRTAGSQAGDVPAEAVDHVAGAAAAAAADVGLSPDNIPMDLLFEKLGYNKPGAGEQPAAGVPVVDLAPSSSLLGGEVPSQRDAFDSEARCTEGPDDDDDDDGGARV